MTQVQARLFTDASTDSPAMFQTLYFWYTFTHIKPPPVTATCLGRNCVRGAGGGRKEEGVQREPRAADDHARTRDAETHGDGARALREREQNGRRGVGSVLMCVGDGKSRANG